MELIKKYKKYSICVIMILVHLNWAVIFPPNLKVYRFTGTSRRTRSVSWTRRTSRSRWRTTTSCPRWKGARPRSSKATSRGTKTGSSSSDRIEITLMTSLATNLLCTYYSTQTYKSSTMVSSQINQTWDQLKCIYFSYPKYQSQRSYVLSCVVRLKFQLLSQRENGIAYCFS